MHADETAGKPIVEFVGLGPKMYSYIVADDIPKSEGEEHDENAPPSISLTEKSRAKGVARASRRLIRHRQYREQLVTPHNERQENMRIGSLKNTLYTFATRKRGLSPYDDKRVLCADGINTRAWGHHALGKRIALSHQPPRLEPDPHEQLGSSSSFN
jgi:hypothetical protein